jgi:DNA primase
MARYSDDSKDKVRAAVDFFDLVGRYTDLRRAGPGQMTGLCPFHEERTPSFRVHEEYFKCFGCGEAGDVFKFVQLKEGLDFKASMEWLADRYGVELEIADEDPEAAARRARREKLLAVLERTATFYARVLWDSPEASGARDYLADRGLDEALLREFRVGYSPSAWDKVLLASRRAGYSETELYDAGLVQRNAKTGNVYDRFRGRIMFPLCDRRGKVLGFGARKLGEGEGPKYLNSPENVVFHKGQNVYAADIGRVHAARAQQVILCEGYTDVIALHQAGIRNAVGLMGTALTPEQVIELQRLAPVVLLALDADGAGQEAMLKAAQVAAGRGVELRVIPLPPGADPADVVQREGVSAMRALTEKSVPFVQFRVDRALSAADLSRIEGKDRAVAQLQPIFSDVAVGPFRHELLRIAADALDMRQELLEQMLGAAPVAAPQRDVAAQPPRAVDDPLVQAERAFLAACLAVPQGGRELLSDVELDEVLSVPLHRRAAAHLRENADAPSRGIESGDELEPLIAELVIRAAEQSPTRATLDAELSKLRLAVHDRRLQRARASGSPETAALAAARPVLKREVDDAIARALGDD